MITLLLAMGTPGLAGEVDAFDASSFGRGQGSELAGRLGWEAGFDEDPWWGTEDAAYSLSDLNVGDVGGEGYGSGWAADNWLINGPDADDMHLVATGRNQDDDFLGVVFHHDGEATFYLAGVTRDNAPPPLEPARNGARLYVLRVQRGETQVLLEQGVEGYESRLDIDVLMNDGEITVRIGDRRPARVEDPRPLPAGRVGFYAYDAGYDGNGGTNAWFEDIRLTWLDEDDDHIIDDEDNCERAHNPGQEDADLDGIGDACDPVDDREPDDTGDPDTGDPGDPGDTGNPDRPDVEDPGIVLERGEGCGCTTGGSAGLVWLPLLGLLLARRRR